MSRVVVVASSDLDRNVLSDVVAPDDDLRIVVAAIEQSRLQWLANDEGDARAAAERAAERIGEKAPTDPTSVDVKPDPPSQLVRDAIAEHRPDRVVIVLREGEDASWLEDGELGKVPGQIDGVPVSRVAV